MKHYVGRRGPRLPAKSGAAFFAIRRPPSPLLFFGRIGASGDVQRGEPSPSDFIFQAVFGLSPTNVLSKVLPRDFGHTLYSGEVAVEPHGKPRAPSERLKIARLARTDFDKTMAVSGEQTADRGEHRAVPVKPVWAAIERCCRIENAHVGFEFRYHARWYVRWVRDDEIVSPSYPLRP
jgi:hypothetical protein